MGEVVHLWISCDSNESFVAKSKHEGQKGSF
jgi:hypothetical protein